MSEFQLQSKHAGRFKTLIFGQADASSTVSEDMSESPERFMDWPGVMDWFVFDILQMILMVVKDLSQ